MVFGSDMNGMRHDGRVDTTLNEAGTGISGAEKRIKYNSYPNCMANEHQETPYISIAIKAKTKMRQETTRAALPS